MLYFKYININLLEFVKNKEMKDYIFFEIDIFLKIRYLLTIRNLECVRMPAMFFIKSPWINPWVNEM